MVSKPFVLEVFVVKSAQAVTLSIIVLMCVTINDRTALKVTDVGLNLNHPMCGGGRWEGVGEPNFLSLLVGSK